MAVATFVTTAWALTSRTVDAVDGLVNPRAGLYADLEALRLDVTPQTVDRALGPPTSSLPAPVECPECGPLSLRIYRVQDEVTVRALFEGEALRLYLVTAVEPDATPPIRWGDSELGRLGETTFAAASTVSGTALEPTDAVLWPGNRRIAYVEVFALGAPGRYEGLLLGHTTEGVPTAFDLDGAGAVGDASDAAPGSEMPPEARDFRDAARPNTFGGFRDDGPLAQLVRDAEVVNAVQTAGTTG